MCLLSSDWMKREFFLLTSLSMDWLSFNFPSLWKLFQWETSRSKCQWPLQSSEMTEEDHLCEWTNNVHVREEISWNILITDLSFYKKQMIVVLIEGMNFPLDKCRHTSFQSLVHLFNNLFHTSLMIDFNFHHSLSLCFINESNEHQFKQWMFVDLTRYWRYHVFDRFLFRHWNKTTVCLSMTSDWRQQ